MSTEIATAERRVDRYGTAQILVPTEGAVEQLQSIKKLQATIKANLAEGFDYGVIPGTQKPTLLKAGAEKIVTLFQARPHFVLVEKIEDWGEKPLFYYHYRCEIVHVGTGVVIGEGEGSCNSKEDKYGYRWVGERELPEGVNKEDVPMKWRKGYGGKSYPVYRTENTEVFSLVNTIQKMAMKRALVAAALVLGRLSDLFTQDLEDLSPYEAEAPPDEPKESASKKAEAPEKSSSRGTTSKAQETNTTTNGRTPDSSQKTESSSKETAKRGAVRDKIVLTDEERKKQEEMAAEAKKAGPPSDEKTISEEFPDGFIPVTKADTDKVTKFLIDNDETITSSKEAFAFVAGIFAERDIKVTSLGIVLANPGHRKALMNALEEKYDAVPEL